MSEGRVPFDGYETWYRIDGDLSADGPAPLVTLHGGLGATLVSDTRSCLAGAAHFAKVYGARPRITDRRV
jgi:hypothetical protein